ncbi:MAG: hypothetical protein PHC88_12510 [Terrimicrobiaceae bacterium]|nr:hypothetical protein [Terrimicrobiaceae bacterium]
MILVLLLIAVAGVLTAGWVVLITARSTMVEQMASASQRRIALENSKALAQEFMLERVMPSTSGSAISCSLSDPSWGSISVSAWSGAPLLSLTKAAGVNHFNPGNGDGYTLDVSATLHNGGNNPTRLYHIKSRSPLLAGTLLSSQTPTLTPAASISIGSLAVAGTAFIWTPNLSMSFTANSVSAPAGAPAISFTNSAGSTLAMGNLALPRQIANPRNGGADFYTGQLDAIHNTNAAANSSQLKATGGETVDGSTASSSNGVVCDGAGHVTITLNTPGLGNVYIPGEISTLTLEGQSTIGNAAADDLPAMLIVIDQPASSSRDLATITLNQHNSRRLDLAVKKASGSLAIQFSTTSPAWRLLLELENTPVAFTATGIATIQGGIRSDRAITLSSGSVRLTPEPDPKNLDRLATRAAWVESFAQ